MDGLTLQYREASQETRKAIPVRACHLFNMQAMLHRIYWYKAEAQFIEAWHFIDAVAGNS